MTPGNAPVVPPTATELSNDTVVIHVIEQAWFDSQPGDTTNRHEEGGWIYMDTNTGEISALRAAPGGVSGIDLSKPASVAGAIVVGKFHTHPNPTAQGWTPGPSPQDLQIDAIHGVPDLIRADDGLHLSGPTSRRGGLGGGPGYPP